MNLSPDLPASALIDLGQGLFAIDTGFQRPGFDAAYLVVDGPHAAFIDTGTNHSVPRLLGALDALGLKREQVDWVIPTHVHLDHAGGVGLLMSQLPQARLLVHPRGARHMIDPSALYQGALAVYGQAEMDRSYGTLLGVAADRVQESQDDQRLQLGQRTLRLIDTPGHAKHHHCIWDERTQGWFTGDTFGLSYREFDTDRGAWLFPTSTPVQFEPSRLRESIQRMLAARPQAMYLTHFSRVTQVEALGAHLLSLLDRTVALAQDLNGRPGQSAEQRHQALKEALTQLYLDDLARHGCTMDEAAVRELLALDIELNAQGIAVWLDRPA